MKSQYVSEIEVIRNAMRNNKETYEHLFDDFSEQYDVLFENDVKEIALFLSDQFGDELNHSNNKKSTLRIKGLCNFINKILSINEPNIYNQ